MPERPPVVVPIPLQYFYFDQQGVVHNMWYLGFVEQARNGYLESVGYPLSELERSGHDIQVVQTEVQWRGAVRYGDALSIEVRPARLGTTSFALDYDVVVEGLGTRATARGTYVIVDAGILSGAPATKAPVPVRLRAALEAGLSVQERSG